MTGAAAVVIRTAVCPTLVKTAIGGTTAEGAVTDDVTVVTTTVGRMKTVTEEVVGIADATVTRVEVGRGGVVTVTVDGVVTEDAIVVIVTGQGVMIMRVKMTVKVVGGGGGGGKEDRAVIQTVIHIRM